MSNCSCSGQNINSLQKTDLNAINQSAVQTCPAVGYQPATVCVPVTVTPFARALPTTTFCCGSPTVTPGTATCPGTVNGSCNFTLTQKICVSVPVNFGAVSTVGAPHVQCGDSSGEDVCTNCDSDESQATNRKAFSRFLNQYF